MVLPYINMNPPRMYTCSPSWNSLPPPSLYYPSGHPSAPAPSILYPASNLDWWCVSYMILYMFQCHSPKSSPLPSPTESKRLFYTSVSLLLSRIQGYRYHHSKFHVYVLVYCIAMATCSSTLAWKIPWMEGPGGLQSMGSLGVRHNWATSISLFTFMHWRRKWQPTPVFLPGESQGRGSLVGCHLWGHTGSDTTEVT